jgi:hypothetical protein
MDEKTRQTLIQKYKDGYAEVAEALAGITDNELDRRPAPGKWDIWQGFREGAQS